MQENRNFQSSEQKRCFQENNDVEKKVTVQLRCDFHVTVF